MIILCLLISIIRIKILYSIYNQNKHYILSIIRIKILYSIDNGYTLSKIKINIILYL